MKEKLVGKKIILIIILIAVVIIAVGAVLFFAFFSPQSINGDWELTVNPELSDKTAEKTYYSFSEPSRYGDGKYKTYYDGGVEEGEYKLSEKNGKKYINMGTENLEYKLDGSTLTITYPKQTDKQTGEKTKAKDYVFIRCEAPDYENEAYKSYDTNKALLGEWKTTERTLEYYTSKLSYTETVKFNDNGVMSIHYKSKDLLLDRYIYYAYTANNGELTFSLVTDQKAKNTVNYEFDKSGNLKFKNDKTTCSIFSDAVFSDVAYKKVN